jgi:catechol 2,3-dioxygenase-like lactoylglutathione lyase family enzyme
MRPRAGRCVEAKAQGVLSTAQVVLGTAVRTFHDAALAAGYEDHGGPGERAIYHPGHPGAFVRDPDGHNVEVVNHNL